MERELEFVNFIESHKNLIHSIANVYCYNNTEKEDLIQEIIFQLWKSFPNYKSNYKFSTWSYRIALNVCISYIRKTTVRNKALKNYNNSFNFNLETEMPKENEKLNLLYKALEFLKPIEKAIITLNLNGCGNKEISEIMGITPSNVGTRLMRIKKKLKKQIIK